MNLAQDREQVRRGDGSRTKLTREYALAQDRQEDMADFGAWTPKRPCKLAPSA